MEVYGTKTRAFSSLDEEDFGLEEQGEGEDEEEDDEHKEDERCGDRRSKRRSPILALTGKERAVELLRASVQTKRVRRPAMWRERQVDRLGHIQKKGVAREGGTKETQRKRRKKSSRGRLLCPGSGKN